MGEQWLTIGTLGLLFIGAAWDVARRALEHQRAHRELHERVDLLTQQIDKQHEQIQAVMGKLNASMAATSARMPRVIGRS